MRAAIRARMARTLLATGALVLVLSTSASAVCAWVLWTKTTGPSWIEPRSGGKLVQSTYTEWEATTAVSKRDECVRLLAATLQWQAGFWRLGDPHVFVGNDNSVTSERTTQRYFCLPDTIDPRGPKGGKG